MGSPRSAHVARRRHAKPRAGGISWTYVWLLVAVVFSVGLLCRTVIFRDRARLENDEKIYMALVDQLDQGRGYTLEGHPILTEPWMVREMYEQRLFFHPPGGIILFWALHRVWPSRGFGVAQLLCYGVFFWSMLGLAAAALRPLTRTAAVLTASLSAFTPIMTHVAGRYWLDGPLLAFTVLAAAVFLHAALRRSTPLACLAGVLFGFASLIKLTAVLVLPGLAALTLAALPVSSWRALFAREHPGTLRRSTAFLLIAVAVQLSWEIWQWRAAGSPFAAAAPKPMDRLTQINAYMAYVTVWRKPWVYLELFPQVVWTLVPSLVLLAFQWSRRELRNKALALLVWIATAVGAHVVLGAMGYPKLLRYVILATPATVLLFVLVTTGLIEAVRERRPIPGGSRMAAALFVLAALGFGLEIAQGVITPLRDNLDLIRPLPGLRGVDYGPLDPKDLEQPTKEGPSP